MLERHALVQGEPPLYVERLEKELDQIRKRSFSRMASRQARGVKNLAYLVFGRSQHAIATLTTPYLERIYNAPIPSMSEVDERMKYASARTHVAARTECLLE